MNKKRKALKGYEQQRKRYKSVSEKKQSVLKVIRHIDSQICEVSELIESLHEKSPNTNRCDLIATENELFRKKESMSEHFRKINCGRTSPIVMRLYLRGTFDKLSTIIRPWRKCNEVKHSNDSTYTKKVFALSERGQEKLKRMQKRLDTLR